MNRGVKNQEFTELAEFTFGTGDTPQLAHARNIIKRNQVIQRGVEEVGLDEKHQEDPLVFVQRDGDRVTEVNFLCKCGRSASLRLEYDKE